MAAAATDYLTHVGSPGTATTLAAPGHTIAGASITVGSTSNWPTDTGVIFAMDIVTLVNGVETRVAGTYTEWEAVVSSATSITGMVLRYGTDQNYPAGSTTRVYIPVSSSRENRLVDGLLVAHNQDGTHKSGAVYPLPTVASFANANHDHTNSAGGGALGAATVGNTQAITGMPVQIVTTSSNAVATGTTQIPNDDTIPQNTEGDQYITLAITPKSATNILVIEIVAMVATAAVTNMVGALFQDSTANALAASKVREPATDATMPLSLSHTMTAGTTSATTFKFRAGPSTGTTMTFNGEAGARVFGAIPKSFMKITEYKG